MFASAAASAAIACGESATSFGPVAFAPLLFDLVLVVCLALGVLVVFCRRLRTTVGPLSFFGGASGGLELVVVCVVVAGVVEVDGDGVVLGGGVVCVAVPVGVVVVLVEPVPGSTEWLSLSTGALRLSLVSVVEVLASAASTTAASGPPSPAAVNPPPANADRTARTARRRAGLIGGMRES